MDIIRIFIIRLYYTGVFSPWMPSRLRWRPSHARRGGEPPARVCDSTQLSGPCGRAHPRTVEGGVGLKAGRSGVATMRPGAQVSKCSSSSSVSESSAATFACSSLAWISRLRRAHRCRRLLLPLVCARRALIRLRPSLVQALGADFRPEAAPVADRRPHGLRTWSTPASQGTPLLAGRGDHPPSCSRGRRAAAPHL